MIRQSTQVRQSDAYDDTQSAGASLETQTTLQGDLNALRAQVRRLGSADDAGVWTQDVATVNGKKRGIKQLNTALDALEVQPVLFRGRVLADVAVASGNNFVVLAAADAPAFPAAVGASSAAGAVVALLAGVSGTHSLNEVAGSDATRPKNLAVIRDSTTQRPVMSNGRTVWGLLQVEAGTADGTAFDNTTHQAQLSFVTLNAGGDDLIACPVADIEDKTINYWPTLRSTLDDLPEASLLDYLSDPQLETVVDESTVRAALAGATGPVALNGQNITSVGNVDGRDVSTDGTKLDGVEAGAQVTNFARVAAALAGASSAISLNNQAINTAGLYNGVDVPGLVTSLATLSSNLSTLAADAELLANKNAANGYAGLTAGKIAAALLSFGATTGTVCQGDDARLGDARSPTGAAGGDLAGSTYPNPTIAALAVTAAKMALATITDAQVAAAHKDGTAGTASMRTLGTGAAQAAAGNDSRILGAIQSSVLMTDGDIITRVGGNPVRLGIGRVGQGPRNIAGAIDNGFASGDMRREVLLRTDFIEPVASTGLTISGWSATTNFRSVDRVGIVQHNSTTAIVAVMSTNGAHIALGGGYSFRCGYRSPSVVSDATDNYAVYLGLGNTLTTGDSADFVGFRYNHALNSGRWQGVCRENSVEATPLDTGVAFAVDTWFDVEFHVNAAGTAVEFLINNVSVGSISSGLPSTSRSAGLQVKFDRTAVAAAAARLSGCDYVWFYRAVSR